MKRIDLSAFVLPLAALLALVLPQARLSSRVVPLVSAMRESPPAPAEATPQPQSQDAVPDLLSAYNFQSGRGATQAGFKASRCVVASVPDPIDVSNLSYTYDRYLDAIQRAMEAAGWVLDRFDIPWLDPDAAKDAAGRPLGLEDARTGGPRFRREPGRLLFRQNRPDVSPATALIFLVGETPTSGVQKRALVNALEERAASCEDAAEPVAFLGPSFSGSVSSIAQVLRARPEHYRMISGSATLVNGDAFPPGLVDFKATVAQDLDGRNQFLASLVCRERDRLYDRLFSWARAGGRRKITVALLVEGNTAFGRSVATTTPGRGANVPAHAQAQPPSDESPCPPEKLADLLGDVDLIPIPFPLHISSLRIAATDQASTDQKGDKSIDLKRMQHQLTNLNLREQSSAASVLPLMSRLEPSSIEVVLSTLLEMLEQQHVRYIGLYASDLQDRLFLAGEVHHHLPNSMVFTASADLLYLHPDVNLDLQGMRVISPYPLFVENQDWTAATGRTSTRLLFATHTAEGEYNALLALLDRSDLMLEYTAPLRTAATPPLWVSVVGAANVWPVSLLRADGGYMFTRSGWSGGPQVSTHDHPWIPSTIAVLCGVPAIYLLVNVAGPLRWRQRWTIARGRLALLFSDAAYSSGLLERRLTLFACLIALTAMYAPSLTIFTLPLVAHGGAVGWKPSRFAQVLGPTLLAVGIVPIVTLVLLQFRIARTGRGSSRVRPYVATAVPWLLLGLTFIVCGAWVRQARTTPQDALLLYVRASDINGGMSPLMPLVLIAGAATAWAVSSLRRLRLLEGFDQYGPTADRNGVARSFLGFAGRSFEGVADLEAAFVRAVRFGVGVRSLPWIAITLMLFGAWWRMFGPRNVPSVEVTTFDSVFAIAFLLVYIALAYSFLRFVLVWQALRRLLQRLAWHPTVEAYGRLREKIPGKPKINLTTGSQIFTALEFSVDRAGRFLALARRLFDAPDTARLFTAELRQNFGALEEQVYMAEYMLGKALYHEALGDWRIMIRCRTESEQALAEVARSLSEWLHFAWRLPAHAAPTPGERKPDEQQCLEYGEDVLTSRVLAFVSYAVPHLQNLVVFVTAGMILMLLAVTSYPFEPRQLLLLFNTAVIVGIVIMTLFVFVQMERDAVLSVLADTEPGQVTWSRDFVARVGVYVFLPLVSLIGAQFPEQLRQLFTWAGSFFGGS